jgi:putative lipoic acid-binding regulatory protein
MAKTKAVNKISDKLVKVSESFQVYMYDNAYMIEVGGRDSEGDYKTVKLMVPALDQLQALIKEVTEMDRDD